MNTTFLVGNGAIEGGWEPVKRAICQTFDKSLERDPNFAFANLTCQLRWLKYQAQKGNRDAADAFDRRYQTYEMFKKSICDEIVNASQTGLMRVRDKFGHALHRWGQGCTCVATTNWDLLFEPYFSKGQINQIIYVHGNVKYPDTLYLPTESIVEPYRPDTAESRLLGAIAGGLMSILQDTNRLVIYGLSLSPLDVELGLVISDGFHNTKLPDEVVVIDRDHSFIVERLKYLGITNVPDCYHPEEI